MAELFVTQSPTFKSKDVIPYCFYSNETPLAECVSLISIIFFFQKEIRFFYLFPLAISESSVKIYNTLNCCVHFLTAYVKSFFSSSKCLGEGFSATSCNNTGAKAISNI